MERAEIVDSYLQALGLQRGAVDLQFLTAIAQRHVATFAFSSIGPRLGEELPLDLESLNQRIVVRRRGGYCFEHNGLLYEILQELGFSVQLVLARVIYNQDVHPGLTHRITLVELDAQRYVVDVGFGPLGPGCPVALREEESLAHGHRFRVAQPRADELHMQRFEDGGFFSLYRFELARYGQADCEVGHFYSHKHPQAAFVNNLVVSRILEHEVRSLRNREYRVIGPSAVQTLQVSTPEQLRQLLEGEFGIQVTHGECRFLFERSG